MSVQLLDKTRKINKKTLDKVKKNIYNTNNNS